MKVTKISWARTYSRNYQSYRAEAAAELEDWETDIDACYDRLREIVNAEIGKESSSYQGTDSDEIIPLREAIKRLKRQRDDSSKECGEINKHIRTASHRLEVLESCLRTRGLPMLKQLIAILTSSGVTLSDERLQYLLTKQNELEELDLKPNNSNSDEDDDEDMNDFL